jgi:pimeloyl-ACP methyl ester carboxylesterase
VQRPLDPARPQGPQIDVHYAVLPALARNKRPMRCSSLPAARGRAPSAWPAPWRVLGPLGNRRDMVLVDQRGTGRSAPLACPDDDAPRRRWPLADRSARPSVQQLRACRARHCRRCRTVTCATTPPRSRWQDADAVRQALGHCAHQPIGASYGTRAVLDYLRQFPQAVRRAVLDGVAPPDMACPTPAPPTTRRRWTAC